MRLYSIHVTQFVWEQIIPIACPLVVPISTEGDTHIWCGILIVRKEETAFLIGRSGTILGGGGGESNKAHCVNENGHFGGQFLPVMAAYYCHL